MLYLPSQGQLVNEEVLQKACSKLNLKTNYSNDPKEIHTLINRMWGEWRMYKKQEYQKREIQLENMCSKRV